MGKNPPASAGGMGSVPDPGRSHMQGAIELTRHNYRACAVRPGLAEREVTAKRSVQTNGFFFWWGGFPLVGIPLPLFPGGKN